MEYEIMNILREIYRDNKVLLTWKGNIREPGQRELERKRGLGQGCFLSLLLFMLYLQRLEGRLDRSGLTHALLYYGQAQRIVQALPGLMYAGNIVLVAGNRMDRFDRCDEHL